MRNAATRLLAVTAVVSLGSLAAFAQMPFNSTWKGELRSENVILFTGYTAELLDSRNHVAGSADVHSDGSFEFRDVAGGDYQLVITNDKGSVLYQRYVGAAGIGNPLEVRLPSQDVARPPSGGVSARQLLHPPSRKAIQYCVAARKYTAAGDFTKAAELLEKAVQQSPDFADAHTNLGAQYLRLGRYRDGLTELQKSIQLDTPRAVTMTDLAYAQLMVSQTAAAIQSARAALQLDPDSVGAHYVLGMALASDRLNAEAEKHLQIAAATMPSARVNLERLRSSQARR